MSKVMFASGDINSLADSFETVLDPRYEAVEASCIGEVVRLMDRHEFEVLVVDLELADASGPGIVSMFKHRWPRSPIIAVSSEYSRESDLRLREEGVVHFAVKPVAAALLRELILHCLDRGAAEGGAGAGQVGEGGESGHHQQGSDGGGQ